MSLVFAAPAPPTVEVANRSERFPLILSSSMTSVPVMSLGIKSGVN